MFGKYDIITLMLILALVGVGTFAIYSATSVADVDANSFFIRQLLWAILGTIVMVTMSFVPLRIINRFTYWFYGFSLFTLSERLVRERKDGWSLVRFISNPQNLPNWQRSWP